MAHRYIAERKSDYMHFSGCGSPTFAVKFADCALAQTQLERWESLDRQIQESGDRHIELWGLLCVWPLLEITDSLSCVAEQWGVSFHTAAVFMEHAPPYCHSWRYTNEQKTELWRLDPECVTVDISRVSLFWNHQSRESH